MVADIRVPIAGIRAAANPVRLAGIRARAAPVRVAGTRAAGIPVRTVALRLAGIRLWLVEPHPAGFQARPAACPAADIQARAGGIRVACSRLPTEIRPARLVVLRPAGIQVRFVVFPAADIRVRTGGIPVAGIRSPIGSRLTRPPADRTTAAPSSDQRAAVPWHRVACPQPEQRAATAADNPAARPLSDPIGNTAVPAVAAAPAPTMRRWAGSVVPPVRSCAQDTINVESSGHPALVASARLPRDAGVRDAQIPRRYGGRVASDLYALDSLLSSGLSVHAMPSRDRAAAAALRCAHRAAGRGGYSSGTPGRRLLRRSGTSTNAGRPVSAVRGRRAIRATAL